MNPRVSSIVLLLALMFGLLAGAWAQSGGALSETYISNDGAYAFRYPRAWVVQEDDDGYILLSDDPDAFSDAALDTDHLIIFITPPRLALLDLEGETPAQILEQFAAFSGLRLLDDILTTPLDARELASAPYQTAEVWGILNVIPFDGGGFGLVIFGTVGDSTVFEDVQRDITASFNTVEASPAATTTPTAAPTCTVRTSAAHTVSVRVGPGMNRAAITFLPAGTDFTVLGQAAAGDGSWWWKLDKTQVAPQKSAHEMWVAQAQVTAAGACGAVPQADIPPLLPLSSPSLTDRTSGIAVTLPFNSGGGSGIFIDFPDWHIQLPAGIRASGTRTAKLVVLVTPQPFTVETSPYIKTSSGQLVTVARIRVDYLVQVIEAATGAPLGIQTFSGSEPPPFPDTLAVGDSLSGEPPPFADVLPWLLALLG